MNFGAPLVKRGAPCYNVGMKLILCCDYGLDDAAATADALAHAAQDGYSEAVLVAAGGNVPPEVSLENAKKLVAHLPFGTVPLTVVDTTGEAQPYEFLKTIHGEDGMGDLFSDAAGFCAPVVPFAQWLEELSGEFDLLSLGPMTLVPRILAHKNARRFVFMGGNIAEEPNFHGYEFNHALDREAFSIAVRAWPHVAVTMDTCRVPALNIQKNPPAGTGFLAKIVRRAREMTFVSGEKGCYIWDDMAVKVLRHPEWFETYAATDRDGNRLTVARYVLGKPYEDIMEA